MCLIQTNSIQLMECCALMKQKYTLSQKISVLDAIYFGYELSYSIKFKNIF